MAEAGRPKEATVAILLMFAGGAAAIGLAVFFGTVRGDVLAALLFLILGVGYVFGGRGLQRGESWGWGAGVFAGALYVLFGAFLLPWAAVTMALAIGVVFLLLRVRAYYGMVRHDPEEDERKSVELRTARTGNRAGLHCPHCGSTLLWIATDGSAVCENCKIGTISIQPPA